MKILICQLRNHGDIIRTFPLIEALKTNYPDSFIGVTCFKDMEATYQLCEAIDEIVTQPRLMPIEDHIDHTRICNCQPLEEVAYQLRSSEYDIYFDLHGIFQSSVLGAIAEIPIRVGRSKHTAKDGAQLFYNRIVNIETKEINKMERHFLIAQEYFKGLRPLDNKPYQYFTKNEVAIIPGSSIKGILKRWGAEKYIELIKELSNKIIVRVVLGPEESDLYNKFSHLKSDKIKVDRVNRWNQYLKIYKRCRYVIGNDTAALHLAIWKQIPTFMICGPTSPQINAIWKYGVGRAITAEERCNCKDVWSGECNYNHRCMKDVTVDTVIEEINDQMKEIEGG